MGCDEFVSTPGDSVFTSSRRAVGPLEALHSWPGVRVKQSKNEIDYLEMLAATSVTPRDSGTRCPMPETWAWNAIGYRSWRNQLAPDALAHDTARSRYCSQTLHPCRIVFGFWSTLVFAGFRIYCGYCMVTSSLVLTQRSLDVPNCKTCKIDSKTTKCCYRYNIRDTQQKSLPPQEHSAHQRDEDSMS